MPSPYGRFGATMDGNTLCGGEDENHSGTLPKNCIYYKMGFFQNPQVILNEDRWHSSSWGRPYSASNVGESHIYAGAYSPDTSEIANDVNSNPSYNYTDG